MWEYNFKSNLVSSVGNIIFDLWFFCDQKKIKITA